MQSVLKIGFALAKQGGMVGAWVSTQGAVHMAVQLPWLAVEKPWWPFLLTQASTDKAPLPF